MNDPSPKTYWKSQAERLGTAGPGATEGPAGAGDSALSRRQFLEAAGFTLSLATLSGCGRAPETTALPFATQPEGVIPGRMRTYASTCGGCPAACGLLVGVRDGRPLKMEGMPEHPLSRGGLCAIGQALPLGLYDSHRLQTPLAHGQPASWAEVDGEIVSQLRQIDARGGAIRLVTPTVTSPSLNAAIDAFLGQFRNARRITLDAASSSAILDAHERTHGVRVLPHYLLDRARVIVSVGADFLGTWISPVEFTAAWQTQRAPTADRPEMSYHVQIEGRMSLTGGNADRRFRVSPDDYAAVVNHLAQRLAARAGLEPLAGTPGPSPIAPRELDAIAGRLWEARGRCVVLCDSQEIPVQVLVNFINHTLGNYDATLDIVRPSLQRQGRDSDVLDLVAELKSQAVDALLVAGTDLTHNLPERGALAAAVGDVNLVVSFAEREDDFSSLAHYVCPDEHSLESWLDAEPVAGVVSLSQPALRPLGGTRSVLESLARWSGRTESAYDILRQVWQERIFPLSGAAYFPSFWNKVVHDGFVQLDVPPASAGAFRPEAVRLVESAAKPQGFVASLYFKVGLTDSRHAHNPWLQELPDPVTKTTWDNYACVSPLVAAQLGLSDGDMVRVEGAGGARIELPALVQPGQHDRVVAMALAYGVRGTDRFANIGPRWLESRPTVAPGERVGRNVAEFMTCASGTLACVQGGIKLTKLGMRRDLASTQDHHSLEVPAHIAPHGAETRDIVQETTLPAFARDPHAGGHHAHHHGQAQLWPEDHAHTGHAWGMVIDLNKCTGCSACLVACQAENNVPVVGKDEVRRRREMHWIRVDRYYSGDDDRIDVACQPMMCQHCDNAPCETVCPVLATVHGDEGLNEQAYNRCVGTRYCANNCPYKVRRFNWFQYEPHDELQSLVLNPDVTVRTRGVMEKCSMCVQRIQEGKLAAKQRGEPLADGDIRTACQQSCPAEAIVFGDLNDPASEIHAAIRNPRRYGVLEEFNFRPSVSYLRLVRNRDEGGDHHV